MRRKVTENDMPADVTQAAITRAAEKGIVIEPSDIEFWVLQDRVVDPKAPSHQVQADWQWEAIIDAKAPPNERRGRYRTVLTRPVSKKAVNVAPLIRIQ